MPARRAWLLAALWLLAPPPTLAAPTIVQVVRDSAAGLADATALAVSPDGMDAYVTSSSGNSVAIFHRDLAADQFRYVGKVVDGIDGVEGLQGPSAIAVSPDGNRVYVTGQMANALVVFDRSPSLYGLLTFAGVVRDDVDFVDGLASPTGVAVSSSGRIFVSSYGDAALSAFDPGFPLLTQVGLWKDGDANPVIGGTISGLTGASGVVTADGYYGPTVYVSSATDSSVSVFTTDFLSSLYEVQVVQDGVDGFDGLATAIGLALSPNGRELYVAGAGESAVAILDRNTNSGELSFNSMVQNGVFGVSGMGKVDTICAEPGGDSVYVGGGDATGFLGFAPGVVTFAVDSFDFGLDFVQSNPLPGYSGRAGGSHVAVASLPDSSRILAAESLWAKFLSTGQLTIYSRDPSTGALTEQQTLPDDVGVVGVRGAQSVVASLDGKHVYVLGSNGWWIAAFARDAATSALSYLGTVGLPGEDPHAVVPRYRMAALSPDGHSLYEARWRDDVIVHWSRDAGTGSLVSTGGGLGSGNVPALVRPSDLVISADGANVYAVGGLGPDGWLMAFSRDAGTGALQHLQTLTQSDVLALRFADSVAISPDGAHVYVGPRSYDGISLFARQPNGTLSLVHTYADQPGADPYDPIQYPTDIEMSPDGARLCVLGGSLACADRNPTTGELGGIHTATTNGHYPDPGALTFSPDANRIYAVAYDYQGPAIAPHSALLTYAVDAPTGVLTLLEDASDTTGIDSVDGAAGVAVSPNGRGIYVAAYRDDDVTVFAPEPGASALGAMTLGALVAVRRRRRYAGLRAPRFAVSHTVRSSPDSPSSSTGLRLSMWPIRPRYTA